MTGSELRIELDRSLELPDRLLRVDDAVVGQQAPTLQIGEIGLQVLRPLPGQPVFRARIE